MNAKIRLGVVSVLAGLMMTWPGGVAGAAGHGGGGSHGGGFGGGGFHGGGFGGGGFHGGGFSGGGFHGGGFSGGGFHGGGFSGGGFHGGGFSGGGFHGGGFSGGGFHGGGMPSIHSFTAPRTYNFAAPHANSLAVPHSYGLSVPHSNTLATPHSYGLSASRSNSLAVPHSYGLSAPHSNALATPHSSSLSAPRSNALALPHSSGLSAPHSNTLATPHSSGLSAPHSAGIAAAHSFARSLGTPGSAGGHARATRPFGNLARSNVGGLAGRRGGVTARNAAWRHEHGGFGEPGMHDRGRFRDRGFFGSGNGYGDFFSFADYPFFYPDLYPSYLDGYYGAAGDYGYAPYYDYTSYDDTVDAYAPGISYDQGPVSAGAVVYPSTVVTGGTSDTETGDTYYFQALDAFQRGDYQTATRLDAHAMIDMPRDVRVHELQSLALFALGDYRGAAREAHAALILGPVIDWPTLYSFYNSLPTYTKQWDALKKYLADNPSSMDARFLAAYHNLMLGYASQAKTLLATVVAKVPQDKVAADLVKQIEGHPAAIAGHTAAISQHKP